MLADTDPIDSYVTTTATLLREGEGLGDRDEIAYLRETLAAERSVSNGLSTACCKSQIALREAEAKNTALVAQNEFLHGTLVGQDQEIVSLRRERDTAQAELFKQGQVRRQHVEEIASLRTQAATWENVGRDMGAVIATRDREITALRENLEGRYSYEGMLQADVRTLVEAADDLAGQLSEAKATVTSLRKLNDGLWADVCDRDEAITSLRTQLARAEAIEPAAKEAFDAYVETRQRAYCSSVREDRAIRALGRTLGEPPPTWLLGVSPTPEDLASPSPRDTAEGEPKCTHCGTPFGPKNLTCGECGRWLAKPAVEPASRESVVKRYQDALNSQGEKLVEAYRKLREAEARLATIQTECQAIARQVPNAIGPIARVLALFSPKEAT